MINELKRLEEIIEYCYEMDMIRKSIFDEIINIIEKLKRRNIKWMKY